MTGGWETLSGGVRDGFRDVVHRFHRGINTQQFFRFDASS